VIRPTAGEEATVVTALGDLVVANLRGRTFAHLAKGCDERITALGWQRLTYRPVQDEPPEDEVRAIATALDVTEQAVIASVYRDLYGDDPMAARRRIARRRATAPYARELSILTRARQLGLVPGEPPDSYVLAQVVAWAELPAEEVKTLIERALEVEEMLRAADLAEPS
jgi:hypothetical protein